MERPKTLSAAFVKTVTTPGRYGDGRGRAWVIPASPTHEEHGPHVKDVEPTAQNRRQGGQRRTGQLSRRLSRRGASQGVGESAGSGPGPRPRNLATGIPTFETAADTVILLHAANWRNGAKSEAQWRASLRDYAMPRLGRKTVDKITTADVLAVLTPIWNEKRETARRVRQRISAIMKWAVAQGYRDDNPAGDAIGAALPKNGNGNGNHFAALPHAKIAGVLATVRESGAYIGTKLTFEFLTLTAARSGEVRGARWDEIDDATWTIPADRMKSGVDHRVPLSPPALAVLDKARQLADGSGLVFPSATGKPLSDNTMSKLLRELNIPAVPHGMRSSFRDWAGESGYARDASEAALAHVVKGVEGAYFRSDLLDRRREMMEGLGRLRCTVTEGRTR